MSDIVVHEIKFNLVIMDIFFNNNN